MLCFWTLRFLARDVTDEPVEFVRDLGQVLLRSESKSLRLDSKLHELANMLTLGLLNVGHHHHRVLQLFDSGLHLLVAHRRVHQFIAAREQGAERAAKLS